MFYGILPMFHAYGLTLCLTFAMSMGARLVLLPKFDEDLVLDADEVAGPPPSCRRFRRSTSALAPRPRRGVSLRAIRFAISGAMCSPCDGRVWESVTGGLLVEGYGMTETSPISLGNPVAASRRPGTVGVPFPTTDIRIVDPDDPATTAARREGELLVAAPGLRRLLGPARRDGRRPARRRLDPDR